MALVEIISIKMIKSLSASLSTIMIYLENSLEAIARLTEENIN